MPQPPPQFDAVALGSGNQLEANKAGLSILHAMSRRNPSAADIPRLLIKLSSGSALEAVEAAKALAVLASASQAGALRLARADALPALVQAVRSPDATVASHAGTALVGAACAGPDLVADAAGSALVAVLRGEDSLAAAAAARVRVAPVMHRRRNGVTRYGLKPRARRGTPTPNSQTPNRCLL